ncbi:MAG: phosphatase PAP2 family protein, partial [Deltaproteobacteria bacterium]
QPRVAFFRKEQDEDAQHEQQGEGIEQGVDEMADVGAQAEQLVLEGEGDQRERPVTRAGDEVGIVAREARKALPEQQVGDAGQALLGEFVLRDDELVVEVVVEADGLQVEAQPEREQHQCRQGPAAPEALVEKWLLVLALALAGASIGGCGLAGFAGVACHADALSLWAIDPRIKEFSVHSVPFSPSTFSVLSSPRFSKMTWMKSLLRSHKWYFALVVLSWLAGGILLAILDQGDAVWYFSQHRTAWANLLFTWGTKLGEPVAYVVVGLVLAFRSLRAAVSLPVAGVVVSVVSVVLKLFFGHDRPFVWFQKMRPDEVLTLVDGVHVYTGATSFPSGHTMSAFALFTLAALWGSRRAWWQVLCFVLALLVGVSRIYLAQHFLQDVVVGSVLGVVLGLAVFLAFAKWRGPAWLEWRLSLVSSKPSGWG